MSQRAICRILIVLALVIASATAAVAQSSTPRESFKVPLSNAPAGDNWQAALRTWSTFGKFVVVTVDQPNRRQSCQLQSFTPDQLVCSRANGRPRTYLQQQVAALLLPGDPGGFEFMFATVFLFHGASGAAVWGTVVLAATCPVCAAATAFAAFGYLIGAAFVRGEYQPDRLLYLAPGQHLSRKFGHVRS
jgi:hypothetical protein